MKKFVLSLKVLLLLFFYIGHLHANSNFIVKDIKVVGLKRVAVGTVLNYLPVEIGEEVSADSTADIIRALYATGFFSL